LNDVVGKIAVAAEMLYQPVNNRRIKAVEFFPKESKDRILWGGGFLSS
jgi:hypothetical protein